VQETFGGTRRCCDSARLDPYVLRITYNTVIPPSGKILSGGVDSNALHRPKRFFEICSSINIEEGRKPNDP